MSFDLPDPGGSEALGLKRIASLHVFVRDLERSLEHYVERLDFSEIAVSTTDFELEHRARASVVQAGGARFVLMEPLGSRGESFRWLQKHPEGIGRIVFDVEDAQRCFHFLKRRGATLATGLERRRVEGTTVVWFDITTAIGDTLFRFIEHEGSTPIMPELERLSPPRGGSNRHKIGEVDHITSNFLTLKPATMWMEHVLGLQPFWEVAFHTQDLEMGAFKGSGLRSVVMWDPASGLRFANNEPAAPFFEASQIHTFCEDHHGPGVQHVALAVDDIISAVRSIRAASERTELFMSTPEAYYELLPQRLASAGVTTIDEDLGALKELGILVDGKGPGRYLLQIFMREAAALLKDAQAGPFFVELIQRKGDLGFGEGNFRALFESIERQQQIDGRR